MDNGWGLIVTATLGGALKAKTAQMSFDELVDDKMRSMKKADLVSLLNNLMNELSVKDQHLPGQTARVW